MLLFNLDRPFNRFSHINVWIEDESEGLLRFPYWDMLADNILRLHDRCKFIHIETGTFQFQVVHFSNEFLQQRPGINRDHGGYFAKLHTAEDSYSYERVHFDSCIMDSGASGVGLTETWFTGMIISESGGSENLIVLIVEEMGTFAERRGIFSYNRDSLHFKDGKVEWGADFRWIRIFKERRRIRLG